MPMHGVLRANSNGVPPLRAMRSICGDSSADGVAALLADPGEDRIRRTFADLRAVGEIEPAHARVRAERHERRPRRRSQCRARPVLRERDDRAAFRRFVGKRREIRRCAPHLSRSIPAAEMISTACRLPSVMVPVLSSSSVSTSPAASTARPLIASTLRCITRSMPAMPIAESRPPMVVGIRQTSSAMSTVTLWCVPA